MVSNLHSCVLVTRRTGRIVAYDSMSGSFASGLDVDEALNRLTQKCVMRSEQRTKIPATPFVDADFKRFLVKVALGWCVVVVTLAVLANIVFKSAPSAVMRVIVKSGEVSRNLDPAEREKVQGALRDIVFDLVPASVRPCRNKSE